MAELALNEIADRIIEAVIEERFLNRENLRKIIRPILTIWIKKTNAPRSSEALQKALDTEIANSIKSRLSMKTKYSKILENHRTERDLYRNKLIEIHGLQWIQDFDEQFNPVFNSKKEDKKVKIKTIKL